MRFRLTMLPTTYTKNTPLSEIRFYGIDLSDRFLRTGRKPVRSVSTGCWNRQVNGINLIDCTIVYTEFMIDN